MGLPGSGKTSLAKKLQEKIKSHWLNADKVRKKFNDWDFSKTGVLRQAKRMNLLAKKSRRKVIIADFICPFNEGRKIFKPDYLIWMDTIKKGRISSFDKSFQKPKVYNYRIKSKTNYKNLNEIIKEIKILIS